MRAPAGYDGNHLHITRYLFTGTEKEEKETRKNRIRPTFARQLSHRVAGRHFIFITKRPCAPADHENVFAELDKLEFNCIIKINESNGAFLPVRSLLFVIIGNWNRLRSASLSIVNEWQLVIIKGDLRSKRFSLRLIYRDGEFITFEACTVGTVAANNLLNALAKWRIRSWKIKENHILIVAGNA